MFDKFDKILFTSFCVKTIGTFASFLALSILDIIGNKRKNQINQKEEKSCEKEL